MRFLLYSTLLYSSLLRYGYSVLSGLPGLYCNYVQNLTWEGDNTILYLQTARYLVKNLQQVLTEQGGSGFDRRRLAETVSYLAGAADPDLYLSGEGNADSAIIPIHSVQDLMDFERLDHVMSRRCLFMARAALQTLESNAKRAGAGAGGRVALFEGPVWNASHVSLAKLAETHGWLMLHKSFKEKALSLAVPPATREALRDLALLFTLSHVEDRLGDFMEAGVLGRDQAPLVHEAVRALLVRVRGHAVSLVDAFDHSDYALNSAIGSSDGDVYARLLRMAQRNPFNATQEGPAWNDILGPFLNRNAKSNL